jgi:hypothetical protein
MTRLMDAVQLCAAPGSTTLRLSVLAGAHPTAPEGGD